MRASDGVTVVVVTWQARELLAECLDSLQRQSLEHDVLVVDNASTDGTDALLRERYPDVEVLRLPTNTGFAGGVCAALEQVQTPYVALLNNDAVADPAWLERSVEVLSADPACAAVTARMLLADRPHVVNNAGVVLLADGYGADRGLGEPDGAPYDEPVEVFGFSGGAAVLRTLAVKAVGGMDPSFFLYYEDTDLSWRLRLAGWSIRYEPSAVVHHRHAASTDRRSASFAFHNERNRLLMLLRCAPASFALGCLLRFGLTTTSLAVKRLVRSEVPDQPVFSPALRLRVVTDVVRRLPASLGVRTAVTSRSTGSRAGVLRVWRGRSARSAG